MVNRIKTVARVDLDDLKIDLQLSGAGTAREMPVKSKKKKGVAGKKKERQLKVNQKISKKPGKKKKKKTTSKKGQAIT